MTKVSFLRCGFVIRANWKQIPRLRFTPLGMTARGGVLGERWRRFAPPSLSYFLFPFVRPFDRSPKGVAEKSVAKQNKGTDYKSAPAAFVFLCVLCALCGYLLSKIYLLISLIYYFLIHYLLKSKFSLSHKK